LGIRRKVVVSVCLVLGAVTLVVGVRVAGSTEPDWMPTRTNDPVLVAAGQELFDSLVPTGDVRRDPYGTACGVPNTDYCASSPSLSRDALVAAIGGELVAQGARPEHRDCPRPDPASSFNYCGEWYSYRGVQVAIMGTAADQDQAVPASIFGLVLTDDVPPEDPPVPLDPEETAEILPPGWGALECTATENGGCVNYGGRLSGAGSVEEARRTLRSRLERAGYQFDSSRCEMSPARSSCTLSARLYRTLGGRDGISVTVALKDAHSGEGFTGVFAVTAENAKPATLLPSPVASAAAAPIG
jgi:hypothetical protein